MVSLMMPAAVIADVTHKVSGNVTITKYKEGDHFKITWVTRDSDGKGFTNSVKQLDQIQENGTYPFEISCEPNPNHPDPKAHSCESEDEPKAQIQLHVNHVLPSNPEFQAAQYVYFE